MTISAQKYQQWFRDEWVTVHEPVKTLLLAIREACDAFPLEATSVFVKMTSEGTFDGIDAKASDADSYVGAAKDKLEKLQLPEDRRAVATGNANAAIDAATNTIRELFDDIREVVAVVQTLRRQYPWLYAYQWDHERDDEEKRRWDYAFSEIAAGNWPYQFENSVRRVVKSLDEADAAAKALILVRDEDLTVSQPMAVAMTRDRVDRAVVDSWNERALKDLAEGTGTVFYEIGDLVIIDAQRPDRQPFLVWAKQQPEINPAAKITISKNAGAFDPGKSKAVGVQDMATFEAAIKRISKNKVEYS